MLGFLHKFPYSNFHEINLDWIINTVKSYGTQINELRVEIDDAVDYLKTNLENTVIEVVNAAIEAGSFNVTVRYTAADERIDIIVTEGN